MLELGHDEFQLNWSIVYGLTEELERLPEVTAIYTIGDQHPSRIGEVLIRAPGGTSLKLVLTDSYVQLRGFAKRKCVSVRFPLCDQYWIKQILAIVQSE